ncbi:MAG: hypothetical protein GX119_04625 [Syntrophomonadaceae bacterium]|jgi:hypothetical protein|nr:hypothetical protein [Syntrophomonadaceae bacterium]
MGNMIFGSQVYNINLEQSSLTGQITISMKYDPQLFKDIPSEQIGIYYWDESRNHWAYLGGVVDSANNRVTVSVDHLALYAVMANTSIPVFKDIQSHWAYQEIVKLANLGIAGGYPDGSYLPDNKITRAEFAKLLVETMGWTPSQKKLNFVDTSHLPTWSLGYIATAVDKDVIKGYADNSFRGDQVINRAEMATMAVRTLSTENGVQGEMKKSSFADDNNIPDWARAAVNGAVKAGILKGLPGNIFGGEQNASRAETAVILVRMLNNPELSEQSNDAQTIAATGVVFVSDISGRHYELRSCSSSEDADYVLIPNSEVLAQRLETLLGQEVMVTGNIGSGNDIHMSGPLLQVTGITTQFGSSGG